MSPVASSSRELASPRRSPDIASLSLYSRSLTEEAKRISGGLGSAELQMKRSRSRSKQQNQREEAIKQELRGFANVGEPEPWKLCGDDESWGDHRRARSDSGSRLHPFAAPCLRNEVISVAGPSPQVDESRFKWLPLPRKSTGPLHPEFQVREPHSDRADQVETLTSLPVPGLNSSFTDNEEFNCDDGFDTSAEVDPDMLHSLERLASSPSSDSLELALLNFPPPPRSLRERHSHGSLRSAGGLQQRRKLAHPKEPCPPLNLAADRPNTSSGSLSGAASSFQRSPLRERRSKPPMHLSLSKSSQINSSGSICRISKGLPSPSSFHSPPPCPPPSTPLPDLPTPMLEEQGKRYSSTSAASRRSSASAGEQLRKRNLSRTTSAASRSADQSDLSISLDYAFNEPSSACSTVSSRGSSRPTETPPSSSCLPLPLLASPFSLLDASEVANGYHAKQSRRRSQHKGARATRATEFDFSDADFGEFEEPTDADRHREKMNRLVDYIQQYNTNLEMQAHVNQEDQPGDEKRLSGSLRHPYSFSYAQDDRRRSQPTTPDFLPFLLPSATTTSSSPPAKVSSRAHSKTRSSLSSNHSSTAAAPAPYAKQNHQMNHWLPHRRCSSSQGPDEAARRSSRGFADHTAGGRMRTYSSDIKQSFASFQPQHLPDASSQPANALQISFDDVEGEDQVVYGFAI